MGAGEHVRTGGGGKSQEVGKERVKTEIANVAGRKWVLCAAISYKAVEWLIQWLIQARGRFREGRGGQERTAG